MKMTECTRCGGPMIEMYRRTLCDTCQVKRDLPGLTRSKPKGRRCLACGSHFWPIRAGYKDCPKCSLKSENPERWPACRICSQHWRPAPGLEDGRACTVCVSSSDKMRRRYLRALHEG